MKTWNTTKMPDDKWYGEEAAYTATDEILIDDSIPVFDRGRYDPKNNPHYGWFAEDIE